MYIIYIGDSMKFDWLSGLCGGAVDVYIFGNNPANVHEWAIG